MVRADGRRPADRRRRVAQALAPPPAPDRRRGVAHPGRARSRSWRRSAATRGHGLPLPPMLGGARRSRRPRLHRRRDRPLGRARRRARDRARAGGRPAGARPCRTDGAAAPARPGRRVGRGQRPVLHRQRARARPPRRRCRSSSAVVDAVAELFPSSPYIHIGGDEVPHDAWRGSPIVDEFKRERGLDDGRRRSRPRSTVTSCARSASEPAVTSGRGRKRRSRAALHRRTVTSSGGARWRSVASSPRRASTSSCRRPRRTTSTWPSTTTGRRRAPRGRAAHRCRPCASSTPTEGWSDAERAHLLGVQACLWTETVHDEQTARTSSSSRASTRSPNEDGPVSIEGGWQSLCRGAARGEPARCARRSAPAQSPSP